MTRSLKLLDYGYKLRCVVILLDLVQCISPDLLSFGRRPRLGPLGVVEVSFYTRTALHEWGVVVPYTATTIGHCLVVVVN